MNAPLIVQALRTPRGAAKASGSLHSLSPAQLLSGHLSELRERSGVPIEQVSDAVFGCVTQTGEQGGNIGKIACMLSGWSPQMSAVTLNRYCASGLSAVNWAAQQALSMDTLTLAGGVEMMSRVPMLSDRPAFAQDEALARQIDYVPPPWSSDLVAAREGMSRHDCDAYAALSQARAAEAARQQVPMPSRIPVRDAQGQILLDHDENIRPGSSIDKLATLQPFYEDGAGGLDAWQLAREPELGHLAHVHTVGNAPCMADGAAALLLGSPRAVRTQGLQPRARILASADACVPLVQTGAVQATQRALQLAGLRPEDIELWEVRDSFAAITLHYVRHLALDIERFNVNGSAIALGHPLGATGAMLISCLLDEMDRRELRLGLVAIAGAMGVATAAVIERLPKGSHA
ncbi:MAG: acetyl-CoA C-acyltransferase [Betaproteobacteria bacterium]